MRRLLLCCLAFSLLIVAAKKERDWETGKVADSGPAGTQTVPLGSRTIPIALGSLTIVGDAYTYTATYRTRDCRFIVGDPVKFAQDKQNKRTLYAVDADGKECKLNIERQERASTGKDQ